MRDFKQFNLFKIELITQSFYFDVFAYEINFISLLKGWSLYPSSVSIVYYPLADKLEVCLKFFMEFRKFLGCPYGCRCFSYFPWFSVSGRSVTKVRVSRCFAYGFAWCRIIYELCYRQELYLIILQIVNVIAQILFQGLIRFFRLSVGLRIECRGKSMFGAELCDKGLLEVAGEKLIVIGNNFLRYTVVSNDVS